MTPATYKPAVLKIERGDKLPSQDAAMLIWKPLTLWGARRVLGGSIYHYFHEDYNYVLNAVKMIGENLNKHPGDVEILKKDVKN